MQNAPGGATLDAWIDFDGSGTWSPEEQIADSLVVTEGDNTITGIDLLINGAREPVLFDVFQEDGTYLGAVRAPDGFSGYPSPIFTRDSATHPWWTWALMNCRSSIPIR